MYRALRNCIALRRFCTGWKMLQRCARKSLVSKLTSNYAKLWLASTVFIPEANFEEQEVVDEIEAEENKAKEEESLEQVLQNACEKGQSAVIELMCDLHEGIIEISQEYRNCLDQQIVLTKLATQFGPLSEKWDELLPLRVKSDELNLELQEFFTIFKIIGEITSDNTGSVKFTSQNEEDADEALLNKYQEFETMLVKVLELNKQKESELLSVKRDSIINLNI